MSNADRIEALSQAVLSTEAGRRVGWARAYAAESSKDELARDVNILRMERDVMRRAASFLYGFFHAYLEAQGRSHLARQALERWSAQVGSVLDSGVITAGKDAAQTLIGADEKFAARRDAEKAEKRTRANIHDRAWKDGRRRERELLVKRYGFGNEAALLNYLERYRP